MNGVIVTTKEELESVISVALNEQLSRFKPAEKKTESEYLTRKEVAKLLGVSLPTLNDWSKRGVVPSYRIETRVRYKKDEVLLCLKKVQTIKCKS
jgi:excisionase family DNA binding protein